MHVDPIMECWVVAAEPYFGGGRLQLKLQRYQHGRLVKGGRLASRVLTIITQSRSRMAGHCVNEWLLAKQKRQNGALFINLADDGEKMIALALLLVPYRNCCWC